MRQISLADPNNIAQREFDEKNDAKRVVIVGGEFPQFNAQTPSLQEIRIERIEVPQIIVEKEIQIVEIEKQVIVKELSIERVEVPFTVVEIREVIREVPVIQHELKIVEVPCIIRETEYKELPNFAKALIVVQAMATIILLLKQIF